MKKIIQTFTIILLFITVGFGGNPLNQNLSPLNSPIIAGQQVYFLSSVVYESPSGNCEGLILIDFGTGAVPNMITLPFNVSQNNPFNMTVGVTFDMPGAVNISQSFNMSTCGIPGPPINPVDLELVVQADAPIPTLSQWGLIIVAIFLMIFGIVSLKKRKTILT